MDKAGPSGDYDGSNTSIRESKTSTLIIEEVYDVNENCLNKLNSIRRGLNLPEFKEYRECLPHAFIDPRRNNYCTISITERSGFNSEQTSPKSTFRHNSVNKNFRSTTSFNLIKDFQPNSPCSRPDTATTESSSFSNKDHYFIRANNADFTNPNHNFNHSLSSIDPFTSAELHLDLTESRPESSVTTSPNSPRIKKAHLSCDDVKIEYELSSCELRKVGPVNNWSVTVGRNHPEGPNPLSARCIEVPPKRMRIRLNTPRFSIPQSSPSVIVHTKKSERKPEAIELQETQSKLESLKLPNSLKQRDHVFRGCLSAVDGQCHSLAESKPRICKSNQIPDQTKPLVFKRLSDDSQTQYLKSTSGESFTQICKEIQACINPEDESKHSLSHKSSTEVSNLKSEEDFGLIQVASKESKPMIACRCSDISSSSRSTTSYELAKTIKGAPNFAKSHKTNSTKSFEAYSGNKVDVANQGDSKHASATTFNSFIEDFNDDIGNNCEIPEYEHLVENSALKDHYSFSRPTTASQASSWGDVQNLKINIPSSIEDDEFVNVNSACLEPHITTVEGSKRQHQNKFRFWRFKRRKDSRGSGDTSTQSDLSKSNHSQVSKSSRSYIVSPIAVETNNKLKLHMITNAGKPDKKANKFLLDLDQRNKSQDNIDYEEKEISLINYSDFCLPIKSLDKLPDEKSVKDILQSMSQSIFKKPVQVEQVDSIGDTSDLQEEILLKKFSNYSQFKTRAELLAEHVKETEKEEDESIELSRIIKEPNYAMPHSSSDDNSEANYFLNRRKQQNTHIRFYEIPSPTNSNININRPEEEESDPEECKYHKEEKDSVDTIVKIDDEDDDINSGLCGNCFCKHLLFPKMSRGYFV